VKRRRSEQDPWEDGHGYDGSMQLGHADFGHHPWELHPDDVDVLVEDIVKIEARRIRVGFWLPGETE